MLQSVFFTNFSSAVRNMQDTNMHVGDSQYLLCAPIQCGEKAPFPNGTLVSIRRALLFPTVDARNMIVAHVSRYASNVCSQASIQWKVRPCR